MLEHVHGRQQCQINGFALLLGWHVHRLLAAIFHNLHLDSLSARGLHTTERVCVSDLAG